MTAYLIEIKRSAQKELSQLPKPVAEKVVAQIRGLVDNPRPNGCKILVGTEHSYRIRVSDYRVVYSVLDSRLIIQVIKIGHRRDVYQ
ncbi:type II toxin-antitoxin system RelE/ParE family toxin [Methylomonas montana]|uniref:type II toxin-antitoxin system RelE family toxin n=1 Tax=Methylomonas montana TaxID=3058963 RepID=UPI002658CCA4|nr:type II toxin-antitoxin system RelE/ParE family toxin [Methylomonas montana]WKJ91162.1 type II toxin-antitoxin system RelE/ParE family toxin [Methylomonas montana]